MRFKVPQNISIEDRIVGPLTVKQFLWFLGAGGVLFILWRFADPTLFIFLAVIVVGAAGAFAFIRPYGQTLVGFISHILFYGVRDKQYVWTRKQPQFKAENNPQQKKESNKKKELVVIKKKFPEQKVAELAKVLDSESGNNFFDKPLANAPDAAAASQAPPVRPVDLEPQDVGVTTITLEPSTDNPQASDLENQARHRNESRTQQIQQRDKKAADQLQYAGTGQLAREQAVREKIPNTETGSAPPPVAPAPGIEPPSSSTPPMTIQPDPNGSSSENPL